MKVTLILSAVSVILLIASPAVVQAVALTPTYHWKLNDGSGTTAVDSAGSLDGTLQSFDNLPADWSTDTPSARRSRSSCARSPAVAA